MNVSKFTNVLIALKYGLKGVILGYCSAHKQGAESQPPSCYDSGARKRLPKLIVAESDT